MHSDELSIDRSLVVELVAAQFPQWANLPVRAVASAGTDNAIYRLGSDLAVRLPRIASATAQIFKEHVWLPRLMSLLPFALPFPVAMGQPSERYPWHWSVYRWLEGQDAQNLAIVNEGETADYLAHFIRTLRRVPVSGWPEPGPPVGTRAVPLITRDAPTRAAIAESVGMVDTDAVMTAWESVLDVPGWHGPPVWTHGDLLPGNLLVRSNRISGVIDFSCLGVGDPACDLIVAWALLSAQTRNIFRAALTVDDATWMRGLGWALSIGLIALPYYQNTNPPLCRDSPEDGHRGPDRLALKSLESASTRTPEHLEGF
jgi:aminoglycoside phosphotransferase (APT) family kinase protein